MAYNHIDQAASRVGDPERVLLCLLIARIVLAVAGICLVLFLFRWSSAVKRDTVVAPYGVSLPDEGKVVIPDYAGGGRGQGVVSVKPWKFGTMNDHPIWVAVCIAAALAMVGAFAGCTWCASRIKLLINAARSAEGSAVPS
jgi:hypothetical protein